ncbi:hypothetical protein Tco_0401198 [Tanacetum coccineum]
MAPCFVNGIEVYDGEINLGEEDNMISKEYAVKLCLEHEVKRGNKVVKKELIVALKGEIYFVKFIINPDEDDVEPETEDEGKDMYDWDQLLDFNLDDIQLLGEEELPQFVCKMGKSNRNKKKINGESEFVLSRYRNTSTTWIYEQLGREEMKKVDRGITMINHTQAEVMGILTNLVVRGVLTYEWLYSKFKRETFSMIDGFCHQNFRPTKIIIMRNKESESEDEEDYQMSEE